MIFHATSKTYAMYYSCIVVKCFKNKQKQKSVATIIHGKRLSKSLYKKDSDSEVFETQEEKKPQQEIYKKKQNTHTHTSLTT